MGESCRYKVIYVYRITRTESHKEFLKIGDTTLRGVPAGTPASAAFAGLQVKINAGAPGFPQPSELDALDVSDFVNYLLLIKEARERA